MKLKKKSLIFTCLAGLACVVGTAFAAWQIIYDQEGDAAGSGTLKADTVSANKGITIKEGKWFKGEDEQTSGVVINFGASKDGFNSSFPVWFQNDVSVGDSTGTYTYKFEVVVHGSGTTVTATKPVVTISDTEKQNVWTEIVNKKLINAECQDVKAPDDGSTSGIYTFDVTFSWGSAFGGINPFKYYNDGSKDAAQYGSDAENNLELISKLDGATFVVSTTLSTK